MKLETAESWARGDRFDVASVPEGRIYDSDPWPARGSIGIRCPVYFPCSVRTALYWRRCRNRVGSADRCRIHREPA